MLLNPARQIAGQENDDNRNLNDGDGQNCKAEGETASENSKNIDTSDTSNDTLPDDALNSIVNLDLQAQETRPQTRSKRRDPCEFETVGARVRRRRA